MTLPELGQDEMTVGVDGCFGVCSFNRDIAVIGFYAGHKERNPDIACYRFGQSILA